MKPLFRILLLAGWYLLSGSVLFSQSIGAVVADKITKEPISDVFVFLANSSVGTATDDSGVFSMELQETQEIVLVFSHINYELLTLEVADARYLRDTFFLRPIEVELTEATVVEKSRAGLRKRRLKAFYKAFLGEDTPEKSVEITNPDVLLFRQEKDKLIAEAKEPLVIENRVLGYNIQFYLEAFELYDNGDLLYKGNTFFESLEGSPEVTAVYRKNRRDIYRKSSRHFFSDLVRRQLDSTIYVTGFSRLDRDQDFVDFERVSPAKLIIQEEFGENIVAIIVQGFLTVINQNILVQGGIQPVSKAELNATDKQFTAQGPQHATSYLRSRSRKILVNQYGKIMNPSEIEEYGYWASLRVSSLLPSDYRPEED